MVDYKRLDKVKDYRHWRRYFAVVFYLGLISLL